MSQVLWCPHHKIKKKDKHILKNSFYVWIACTSSPTLTMMPLHMSGHSHTLKHYISSDDSLFPVNICNNLGQFSLPMTLKNTVLKKSLNFIKAGTSLCADLDMAPNMTSGYLPLNWLIVQHLATGIRWWSQCSAAFPRDFCHNFSSLYFNLPFYVSSCLMWFLFIFTLPFILLSAVLIYLCFFTVCAAFFLVSGCKHGHRHVYFLEFTLSFMAGCIQILYYSIFFPSYSTTS